MRNSKGKYIGINQRVPFNVLDNGIIRLLQTGQVDREDLKQDLREYTKGENRVSKAAGYAYAILTRPKLLMTAISKLSSDDYLKLPNRERKAFILTLFACTFPITYDLLVVMAKGFKTQQYINKKFISQKLSAIYGSNRTLDIAIDALLPMVIELETIQRAKRSIYELSTNHLITTPIIAEAYIYTDIFLSGSKSILVEDIHSSPWFSFNTVEYIPAIHKRLLRYTEGRIGGGYIAI